jgi:hypothetical protein
MSAIGPKRTSAIAPHMSAFGGKADMRIAVAILDFRERNSRVLALLFTDRISQRNHPIARSLCNIESIVGQFYPATLLARLVTLELRQHRQSV